MTSEKDEILKYQDIMVGYTIKAKELQKDSGVSIGLSLNNSGFIPVDMCLKSLLKMTTRTDLKDKLIKALGEKNE
jgi:hypothetical protein